MIQYAFDPSQETLNAAAQQNESVDVLMQLRTSPFTLLHTHKYWECLIMKENSAINSLDGAERIVSNRDFCLIRPENAHQIKRFNRNNPQYYNLMIRTDYLLAAISLINPQLAKNNAETIPQYGTCEPHLHAEIIQLLDKTFPLSTEEVVKKQQILRLVVLKLLAILLTPKTVESSSNDLASQIVAIMSKPENMRLSIREIAEKAGYCQEYIIRTLRKSGSTKPHKVFMGIKLEYARSLLSSTDFQMVDVAEQIGISDVSYFSKLFKRKFGVSPSVYRKNNPLH